MPMQLRSGPLQNVEIQRRRGGEKLPTECFRKPVGVLLFLGVLQFLSRMKVLAYSFRKQAPNGEKRLCLALTCRADKKLLTATSPSP
jgi:hypothetical protein